MSPSVPHLKFSTTFYFVKFTVFLRSLAMSAPVTAIHSLSLSLSFSLFTPPLDLITRAAAHQTSPEYPKPNSKTRSGGCGVALDFRGTQQQLQQAVGVNDLR
jgi:hypothetical protein